MSLLKLHRNIYRKKQFCWNI